MILNSSTLFSRLCNMYALMKCSVWKKIPRFLGDNCRVLQRHGNRIDSKQLQICFMEPAIIEKITINSLSFRTIPVFATQCHDIINIIHSENIHSFIHSSILLLWKSESWSLQFCWRIFFLLNCEKNYVVGFSTLLGKFQYGNWVSFSKEIS